MPIQIVKRYSRLDIQKNPSWLYLFGDNLAREGFGGQAGEARGEPNTVGLPTLHAPGRPFSDADLPIAKIYIDEAITKLKNRLEAGGTVVLPEDGVGTGIANLEQNAPTILQYIEEQIDQLRTTDFRNQILRGLKERVEYQGYKGKKRDEAALNYLCGAAKALEIAGNPYASLLARVCFVYSIRGWDEVVEMLKS